MEFADKTIVCVECQAEFTHSADDQRRFQERGFANEPRRCPECREKRRAAAAAKAAENAAAAGESAASEAPAAPAPAPRPSPGYGSRPRPAPRPPAYQPRNSRFSGGGDRDRDRQGHGHGHGPVRESFEVTCAECGVRTTVPFKPAGNRPVYCRDCYRSKRPADDRPPPRRDDRGGFGGDRPSYGNERPGRGFDRGSGERRDYGSSFRSTDD